MEICLSTDRCNKLMTESVWELRAALLLPVCNLLYFLLLAEADWSVCFLAARQQPISRRGACKNHRVTLQEGILQVHAGVGGASAPPPAAGERQEHTCGHGKKKRFLSQLLLLWTVTALSTAGDTQMFSNVKWWRRAQIYQRWRVVMVMCRWGYSSISDAFKDQY